MGNRAENEIEAYLPFWKQLSQPQQEKILREAVLKTAKKGEIIHRGNADCLGFVIVKGFCDIRGGQRDHSVQDV